MDNRSYVASRVFSPYKELPWGTFFSIKDKEGKDYSANLLPKQWESSNNYGFEGEELWLSKKIPDIKDIWEPHFIIKDMKLSTADVKDGEYYYYKSKLIALDEFDKNYTVEEVDTSTANRVLSDGEDDYVLSMDKISLCYFIYNLNLSFAIRHMDIKFNLPRSVWELVPPNDQGYSSFSFSEDRGNPVWLYYINKAKEKFNKKDSLLF